MERRTNFEASTHTFHNNKQLLDDSEIGKDHYCMSNSYKRNANLIADFEVRGSDIFVASHPESGTTWLQEMVWLIGNNLDFEGAKRNLSDRFPVFETSVVYDFTAIVPQLTDSQAVESTVASLTFAAKMKSPRCIQTHLPWSLLPKGFTNSTLKPKVIYVVQNPKDVCLAYYNHLTFVNGCKSNFESFCDAFLNGKVFYGPFWNHVIGYWKRRYEPHVLFIKYDDMVGDLRSVVYLVTKFLQKNLDEYQTQLLVQHLEGIKNNAEAGRRPFNAIFNQLHSEQRGGLAVQPVIIDDYRQIMSTDLIKKFDSWSRENTRGTDLRF